MSRLAQLMAAKKAQAKAGLKVPVTPAKIVDPVDPVAEVKSVIAKPARPLGALAEISTKISEAVSEADQKVAEQRAKGVYDLPEEAVQIMGADADALLLTMQSLDAALVEKTPEIRTLSYEIRKNLEQYPELVHILTDEQLHIMVQGYLTIANVKTAPKTKAAKTASANKKADAVIKSLASKSVDDLF